MAHFVIDLMGDEDVIVIKPEVQVVRARDEELQQKDLEEVLRRAPQPTLQIVPISSK